MPDPRSEESDMTPSGPELKIPSEDLELSIPSPEPETKKIIEEVNPMEVHHNPDLHHKPKPWNEYLLKGLMIFLAVIMGYIAENLIEHFENAEKERTYMKSMVRDLQSDTADISK